MSIVLVVDDSAVDRRLAGGLLEKGSSIHVMYATNGVEALRRMGEQMPDMVVTDLQMPEMNGLELVESVRAKYPLVPVVLMTAHGSEEIAVRALQSGAASYVPKPKLAAELLETVENVLSVARADRHHERLKEYLDSSEWSYLLDNDTSLVPPLVDQLQRNMAGMQLFDDTVRIRVGIALEEALLNALYHGNLELTSEQLLEASSELVQDPKKDLVEQRRTVEPYRDRKIHVNARISRGEARYTIRDDGPGFDLTGVPDPTDPANLERECGRGLLLMRLFMDEVQHNSTGNEVTLVKRSESA